MTIFVCICHLVYKEASWIIPVWGGAVKDPLEAVEMVLEVVREVSEGWQTGHGEDLVPGSGGHPVG